MLTALWILNGMLATAFLITGLMKLVRRKEDLRAAGQAWTEDFSPRAVRGIGVAETLGAAGLVVPLATGIATILTPVAACGLVTVMIGAVAVHRRRHERFIAPAALGATAVVSAGLGFAIVLG